MKRPVRIPRVLAPPTAFCIPVSHFFPFFISSSSSSLSLFCPWDRELFDDPHLLLFFAGLFNSDSCLIQFSGFVPLGKKGYSVLVNEGIDALLLICATSGKMKGSFQALWSVKLPFITITLLCVAFLFCWEKTPFFSALFSAQNEFPQISPDILLGSPVTSITPKENILVDSETPGFLRNGSSDKFERQVGEPNQNYSAKETLEIGNKGILVGSPDLSVPSQQQILADYKSPTFVKNGMLNKLQEHEADVEVQNVSPNDPTSASNQVCNYAKGKWVETDDRLFYSGFGCKQWLSSMWACRMTQRTDFSYEKFRWQPQDCELEEFEGSKFLRRMQDKTLAFIGDSLGRQQFQSLMCMITGGQYRNDVRNVGKEFGLVKARGAVRPDGWAYRFRVTNTTILFYWSASLCDLEPINRSDPSTQYAMHLDRPPAFLRKYLHRFDILVLNTGHHWNRGKLNTNRWLMYVDGQPNTNRRLGNIGLSKNFTVHSIIRWVDSQLPYHPNLKAFFRSISPRHFFNGDWNTGGTCDNSNPLSKGMEVLKDNPSDSLSSGAVKGTAVKLLDITGPSELRDEGHISRYSIKGTPGVQDCLHWCLPGVPDTWNAILFAML